MSDTRTVTVYVRDILEAKEFYCNELGFDPVAQYDERILQLKHNNTVFIVERIEDLADGSPASPTIDVERLRSRGLTFVHETPRPFPSDLCCVKSRLGAPAKG